MSGFVRSKRVGKHTYHYLVANERKDGRVKQRVLVYLGRYPSIEVALEELPKEVSKHREWAAKRWARAETAKAQCHPAWLERNGGEVPKDKSRGVAFRHSPTKQYWSYRHDAENCERLARLEECRLERIRDYLRGCSAQDCLPKETILGTTKQVEGCSVQNFAADNKVLGTTGGMAVAVQS